MITRIELTNFMSHAHTVIEPAPGLTVLVGPNNCGKSAVVAALQILCRNDTSTYVMRHGERECAVRVETDDGHVVEWRRKNAPSYSIDGQLFDRLGRGDPPSELHQALRLNRVEGGDDSDFDVHFGAQKTPIFLLGSSPANAARFFASSSDAIRLVQMQQRHKAKLTDRQRHKVRLEEESKQLNAELESLQPVAELERGLTSAEQHYQELLRLAQEIDAAARSQQALHAQEQTVREFAARAGALQPLAPPPEAAQTAPLANMASALRDAAQTRDRAQALEQSLAALPAPPELADTRLIQQLHQNLIAARSHAAECDARTRALADLPAAPQLGDEQALASLAFALESAIRQQSAWRMAADAAGALREPVPPQETLPLANFLKETVAAIARAAACQTTLEAALKQLATAEDDLREFAETALCPTCGAPFDAERLFAAAGAGGLGGHEHG